MNFEKAVNWLSPHYREELNLRDTCGCNAVYNLLNTLLALYGKVQCIFLNLKYFFL